jgi:HD-GYP domain-containing protein (c-di-GMP phosphodiesterase class II)
MKGQSNVAWLPFKKNIDGFILYHHELGNGKGPFRKREGEYPFEAAILAAADSVDVTYHLQHISGKEKLAALRDKVAANAEIFSTRAAIDALLEVLDADILNSLRDENISKTLDSCLPRWNIDVTEPSVDGIADFIGHVIDFKSRFTRKHTSGIAGIARLMGKYYGYGQ